MVWSKTGFLTYSNCFGLIKFDQSTPNDFKVDKYLKAALRRPCVSQRCTSLLINLH